MLIYTPYTIIYHSEIGLLFTNWAIKQGPTYGYTLYLVHPSFKWIHPTYEPPSTIKPGTWEYNCSKYMFSSLNHSIPSLPWYYKYIVYIYIYICCTYFILCALPFGYICSTWRSRAGLAPMYRRSAGPCGRHPDQRGEPLQSPHGTLGWTWSVRKPRGKKCWRDVYINWFYMISYIYIYHIHIHMYIYIYIYIYINTWYIYIYVCVYVYMQHIYNISYILHDLHIYILCLILYYNYDIDMIL